MESPATSCRDSPLLARPAKPAGLTAAGIMLQLCPCRQKCLWRRALSLRNGSQEVCQSGRGCLCCDSSCRTTAWCVLCILLGAADFLRSDLHSPCSLHACRQKADDNCRTYNCCNSECSTLACGRCTLVLLEKVTGTTFPACLPCEESSPTCVWALAAELVLSVRTASGGDFLRPMIELYVSTNNQIPVPHLRGYYVISCTMSADTKQVLEQQVVCAGSVVHCMKVAAEHNWSVDVHFSSSKAVLYQKRIFIAKSCQIGLQTHVTASWRTVAQGLRTLSEGRSRVHD